MSARALPFGAAACAALALAATPTARALAQRAPAQSGPATVAGADSAHATAADPAERGAVSISVHYGTFRPAGRSELYALLDRALAPGAQALRPRVTGAALHVRVTPRWAVLLGAEAGGRQTASVSRVRPAGTVADVRQWTAFDLTAVQYAGAEWQALRWPGARAGAPDRARLTLGAGLGRASYRVRQGGDFVDVDRRLGFGDEFRSEGTGAIRFAAAAVEVPVRRWLGVQATARRQAGSAPMRADYASFDRLDLGGTRLDLGLHLRPAAARRR